MPRKRKEEVNLAELPKEEFEALKVARRRRLETVFPEGTMVELVEDWIGFRSGLEGFVFVEEIVGHDVWRVAFTNGFRTDLSIDLDRVIKVVGKIDDVQTYLESLDDWNPGKRRLPP